MNSLVNMLLSQHRAELIPLRCSKKMALRLSYYFEEAVVESALSAMFIQSRCPQGKTSAELRRFRQLTGVARQLVFFTCDSTCASKRWSYPPLPNITLFESPFHHGAGDEGFTIILDSRFSVLQAYERLKEGDSLQEDAAYRMVWSFEPNVIYSALQYLMARTQALHPDRVEEFTRQVRENTPRINSVYLTLSIMTKFAGVLQSQTERAHAVNHLSSVIRSSLGLHNVLQTAAEELGRTLGARRCALWLWEVAEEKFESLSEYRQPGAPAIDEEDFYIPREVLALELKASNEPVVLDNDATAGRTVELGVELRPVLAVPIIYHERVMGAIAVEDQSPTRLWDEEEVRLMEIVADQLAVAVSHARLFEKVQESALTDGLTGLYNRRHFEGQLDHELRLSRRSQIPLSLVMIDLDYFKKLNDTYGHQAGDAVLRQIAQAITSVLRTTDTPARYGGEEFAVILPQTDVEGALNVAEKIRQAIEAAQIPEVGSVTASLGLATFPQHAQAEEELISVADQALYQAKRNGRNQVCIPPTGVLPEAAAGEGFSPLP